MADADTTGGMWSRFSFTARHAASVGRNTLAQGGGSNETLLAFRADRPTASAGIRAAAQQQAQAGRSPYASSTGVPSAPAPPAPTVPHNGCEALLDRRLRSLPPLRAQRRGGKCLLLLKLSGGRAQHLDVNEPLLPVQALLGGAAGCRQGQKNGGREGFRTGRCRLALHSQLQVASMRSRSAANTRQRAPLRAAEYTQHTARKSTAPRHCRSATTRLNQLCRCRFS